MYTPTISRVSTSRPNQIHCLFLLLSTNDQSSSHCNAHASPFFGCHLNLARHPSIFLIHVALQPLLRNLDYTSNPCQRNSFEEQSVNHFSCGLVNHFFRGLLNELSSALPTLEPLFPVVNMTILYRVKRCTSWAGRHGR